MKDISFFDCQLFLNMVNSIRKKTHICNECFVCYIC